MASATATPLSHNDTAVLGALFDPEASLTLPLNINPSLPEPYEADIIRGIKERENRALLSINETNPTKAVTQRTIRELDDIITTYPEYASAWNNRAQATRLLFDLADVHSHSTELNSIYRDLSRAIELATPKCSLNGTSASLAKVLASAHTHRGFLLWRASQTEAINGMLDAIQELRGISKDRLEEMASVDFAAGARYGNSLARQLAVKTNPYAKLCGSIVREAMQKEIDEYYRNPSVFP